MSIVPESPEKTRPKPSPLLREWTKHPQRIIDALHDATASIDAAKAMRRELDAVARGDLDPDQPGLRAFWAWLGMAGAHGLLDDQRRWYAEWAQWSDREIAPRCGVGAPLVGKLRGTVIGLQSDTRKSADGRTINTANIGRKPEPIDEGVRA